MTLVQQLVAAAAPHDAVTGQALALHRLLLGWGYESEVLAQHVHPSLARDVLPLSRRRELRGATILRYSIWSAAVEDVLARPPRRLGLVYHNVTPERFLRHINPATAALCAQARSGLSSLADRVDVAMADSRYNARELEEAGFAHVDVIPLLLDLPARRPEPPPSPPIVLTVGRLVPNKRLDVLVRGFALYQRTYASDAELVLLGAADGFESYRDALLALVRRLGVRGVRIAGRVNDEVRDDWYRRATVYACTSAHEGFCAPLAEAMAVGLPVVAVDAAAVPETLGGGGLVLPTHDPCLLAEALQEISVNAELRAALDRRAEARVSELSPHRTAARLRAAVRALAGGS